MRLRDLEYFEAVARTGSIRAASRELHVSEPSVSVQIRTLERDLGVELFSRQGRQLVLSEDGVKLAPSILQVLAAVKAVRLSAEELREPRGNFRVGVVPAHASRIVPEVIDISTERYPRLSLQISENGSLDLEQDLLALKLDLAVVVRADGFGSAPQNLDYLPMRRGVVVAECSADHPLASHSDLDVNDLVGHRLLFYRPGYLIHQVISAMLGDRMNDQVLYQTDNGEAARHLVRKGLGVSFATDFGLEDASQLPPDFVQIPITGAPQLTLNCAYFRGRRAAREFSVQIAKRFAA